MHQVFVIVRNSLTIFVRSFFFWGTKKWFIFWCTFPAEHKISLGEFSVLVRARSLHEKIVDLFMAVYCICDDEYQLRGFEMKPRGTVIDIGGHIGSFSLVAAKRYKAAKVFVYEPDHENIIQLSKNLILNHISNVEAVCSAVAGSSGRKVLYKDSLNSAKNSLVRATAHSFSVPTVTLGDIFSDKKITVCDFLKLDCEGSEYEILFGADSSTLKKIRMIAMEVHTPKYFGITNPLYTPETLARHLEDNGFHVFRKDENKMHHLVFASRVSP